MRLLFYLLFTLLLSTCSRKAYENQFNQSISSDLLSAEAVAEDLDYLHAAVERVAPLPYLTTDTARVAAEYAAMKARGAQSPVRFYESLLRVLGSYDAAHYFVQFPKDAYLQELRDADVGVLPFKTELRKGYDDHLEIVDVFPGTDSLHVGWQLLKINGLDADSLFKAYYRYVGGVDSWKERTVSERFHLYLYLNGTQSPFTLGMVSNQSHYEEYTYDGYRYHRNEEFRTVPKAAPDNPTQRLSRKVAFKLLDQTGYLRLSSFSGYDYELYRQFLQESFTELQETGAERLIVDLRGNGGGNDQLARWLLDYTTDKPYRFYGGNYLKVSPEAKRNYRYSPFLPWVMRQMPYGPGIRLAGERHPVERNLYKFKAAPSEAPVPNPLRFHGPVFYIIDSGVYSSGVSLANAVEDFDLGTLIGQPTGGAPTEPGELVRLRLPQSGFTVNLPSKYFIRANGDAGNLEAVQPEVVVPGWKLARLGATGLVELIDNLDR